MHFKNSLHEFLSLALHTASLVKAHIWKALVARHKHYLSYTTLPSFHTDAKIVHLEIG